MSTMRYAAAGQAATLFEQDGTAVWLKQLCGLLCGQCGCDKGPPEILGLLLLDADTGHYEGLDWVVAESAFTDRDLRICWRTTDKRFQIDSTWTFCSATGVWRRRDRLQNISSVAVTITRCLARFTFSPGRYRLYSQESVWANENRGIWQDLGQVELALRSIGGRSCDPLSPYLGLMEADQSRGVVFHIVPQGNWVIQVRPFHPWGSVMRYAVLEMGLSDAHLRLPLPAGASVSLPDILIQEMPGGAPQRAAPGLHQYLKTHNLAACRKAAPVVYNTWFDAWDTLDVARLRRQLAAARQIGCEVFVVDAGWYGRVGKGWGVNVGDWREKSGSAFDGRMRDFADEVRAAGLAFGIWMEPERLSPLAPAIKEHPAWFIPVAGRYYPDLVNPAAYDYIRTEIARVLADYRAGWIKLDFNAGLGIDPSGQEFRLHYERWYRLLDDLRGQFPHVFFEGCASGGMRLDIGGLSHYDGHFLSDNVNPQDVLRLFQGALLRMPPGHIGKWVVLRSAGRAIPKAGVFEDALLTPSPGGWTTLPAGSGVDFAARVCLPGMLGFSGDLAGLPDEVGVRLAEQIRFYKQWRSVIHDCRAHLLTPPGLREQPDGWAAIQLQSVDPEVHLVFAYRLKDPRETQWLALQALEGDKKYQVADQDQPALRRVLAGRDLMDPGLRVSLPAAYSAAVFVLTPV